MSVLEQKIAAAYRTNELSFSVSKEMDSIVPTGSVTVHGFLDADVGDSIVISGISGYVREIDRRVTRSSIETTFSLSDKIGNIFRTAPSVDLIFSTMTQSEADAYLEKNDTRAEVRVKIGDEFGREGWTNIDILKSLGQASAESSKRFRVVTNIYKYWIKQFEVSTSDTYLEAAMRLAGIFRPQFFFRGGTLFILKRGKYKTWMGNVRVGSTVAGFHQRDLLNEKPYKLTVRGGLGEFRVDKYPKLSSIFSTDTASAIQEAGSTGKAKKRAEDALKDKRHTVYKNMGPYTIGPQYRTQQLTPEQTEALKKDLEPIPEPTHIELSSGGNRLLGVKWIGKLSKTKTESTASRATDFWDSSYQGPDGRLAIQDIYTQFSTTEITREFMVDLFGNEHEFFRHTVNRTKGIDLDGGALPKSLDKPGAIISEELVFTSYDPATLTPAYETPRITAVDTYVRKKLLKPKNGVWTVTTDIEPATYKRERWIFEKDTGNLLRRTSMTWGPVAVLDTQQVIPGSPPKAIPLVEMSTDRAGDSSVIADFISPVGLELKQFSAEYRLDENRIIEEEKEIHDFMSKDSIQIINLRLRIDPNTSTNETMESSVRTVTSTDISFNRKERRKMEVYAEKILGGTGPSVEVSDGNIVDWEQAEDILNEINWQFDSDGKRLTTIEIPGEIFVDAGWGVSGTMLHSAAGVASKGMGERARISSYERSKDAGAGTARTTITVEGEL